MCNYHENQVGPLRSRLGNNCCEECLGKFSTLKQLIKEDDEIEVTIVVENPTYLNDLVNGWWHDGSKYYFSIQGEIYSAKEIPMDYGEFKRAILFDKIDAERCGVIQGTTVTWY